MVKSRSSERGFFRLNTCQERRRDRPHPLNAYGRHAMHESYIQGFISEMAKARLILKANKIGYTCSIEEYGAGTFITFIKDIKK